MQDGSILTIGSVNGGAHVAYCISLRWARGCAAADKDLPLRLSAAALAGSSAVVELGGLAVPAALGCADHPTVHMICVYKYRP